MSAAAPSADDMKQWLKPVAKQQDRGALAGCSDISPPGLPRLWNEAA
jgi:hypothetical protein